MRTERHYIGRVEPFDRMSGPIRAKMTATIIENHELFQQEKGLVCEVSFFSGIARSLKDGPLISSRSRPLNAEETPK